MTLFKRYLKTFSLAYLFFAVILWFGCALSGDLDNELASYFFWFTIIFGLFAVIVQSIIFTTIPVKVTNKKLWFIIIAILIELLLLNILAYYGGKANFTIDTVTDLFHKTGHIAFPLSLHTAIVLSIVVTALTKNKINAILQ